MSQPPQPPPPPERAPDRAERGAAPVPPPLPKKSAEQNDAAAQEPSAHASAATETPSVANIPARPAKFKHPVAAASEAVPPPPPVEKTGNGDAAAVQRTVAKQESQAKETVAGAPPVRNKPAASTAASSATSKATPTPPPPPASTGKPKPKASQPPASQQPVAKRPASPSMATKTAAKPDAAKPDAAKTDGPATAEAAASDTAAIRAVTSDTKRVAKRKVAKPGATAKAGSAAKPASTTKLDGAAKAGSAAKQKSSKPPQRVKPSASQTKSSAPTPPAPPPPPAGAVDGSSSETISDAPPPVASPAAASSPGEQAPAPPDPVTVSAAFRKAVAPDEEIDPRLEQFLQKAAPILAVERGINARSRVLLGAVARDLGLSDEELEAGIKALQHGRKETGKSSDPAVDAFYRYLHARLEKFKGILTLELQQKAVDMAREKFQVDEEAARQAIADVATELRVRRVTLADAERHIASLISQKVGDAAWLDDETMDRLRAVGREWGMNPLQVDAVVRRHMTVNQQSQKKEHRFVIGAVVAAIAVVVVLLGLFVYQIVLRPIFEEGQQVAETDGSDSAAVGTSDGGDDGKTASDVAADGSTPKPPVFTGPPAWWSAELSRRQFKARSQITDYGPICDGLAAADPAQRGEAYVQLVAASRTVVNDYVPTKSTLLLEIVATSYLLEPDDKALARLRDALVAQAAPDQKKLIESTLAFDQAVWAVRAVDWSLRMDGLDEARADQLAQALSRAIGVTIDRKSEKGLLAQCLPSVVAQSFQTVTAAVASNPNAALDLFDGLRRRLKEGNEFKVVPQELVTRLMTDFVVAYLNVAADQWENVRSAIDQCAYGSALDQLKLLEVFEHSDDPVLKSYLGVQLLNATGTPMSDLALNEVSAAIRKTLGVSATAMPQTPEDRWGKLRPLAKAALDRAPASPVDQRRVLEETVELAWLASLCSALAQQESGYPLFDQLLEAGQPPLKAEPAEAAGADERPTAPPPAETRIVSPTVRKQLNDYFATLAKYESADVLLRQSHLRGLAREADRLPDVTAAEGEAVAGYLLGKKPETEHERIVDSVEAVTRWPFVRLALADRVESSPLPDPLVAQIVSKALRSEVAPDGPTWRAAARQQLLRSVLTDLQAGSTRRPAARKSDPVLDLASAALQSLYRERARQLRLDAATYEATRSPGETLRLLVGQTQAQVSATGADLSWLAPRLEVIDYLSSDDLERTVALQRVWLKLLALQVRTLGSQQGGRADELLRDLEKRDATASHLLTQLRDGEEITLHMWLLYGPSGMTSP